MKNLNNLEFLKNKKDHPFLIKHHHLVDEYHIYAHREIMKYVDKKDRERKSKIEYRLIRSGDHCYFELIRCHKKLKLKNFVFKYTPENVQKVHKEMISLATNPIIFFNDVFYWYPGEGYMDRSYEIDASGNTNGYDHWEWIKHPRFVRDKPLGKLSIRKTENIELYHIENKYLC